MTSNQEAAVNRAKGALEGAKASKKSLVDNRGSQSDINTAQRAIDAAVKTLAKAEGELADSLNR